MRVAVLVVLSACGRVGFDARVGDGDARTDGTDDGRNDRDASDASSSDDDGGLIVPPCSGTVLLLDTFDDGVAGPSFNSVSEPGFTVTEPNGAVQLSFAAAVTADSEGFYTSSASFDCTELCVSSELLQVPVNGGIAFFLLTSGQVEVELAQQGAQGFARQFENNFVTELREFPFDLARDNLWQISVSAGNVSFATSNDGLAYRERASWSGFVNPRCDIELGARADTAVTNGGAARFASASAYGP